MKGSNGFGYDPIFYLPDFKKTMAELLLPKKNKISHRAIALDMALAVLNDISGKSL
jgi:XTP/dITP diphosphohydrolase